MRHLLEIDESELRHWLVENDHKSFRARQILDGVIQRRASTFDDLTDVSKSLREELSRNFTIWTTEIAKHSVADDGTEKLLLKLDDGGVIECVLLRDGIRRTICVSSQVGCAMGCVFCASGLDGLQRNLRHGEIVEQMMRLQILLPTTKRLSHIVMMGMGEPLANLENMLKALAVASDSNGLGISPRRITISTVGLPEAMHKLAELDSRFHLAVSLHAPNDDLRNELVPVNEKIGIEKILEAADQYFRISGRRLTFEYVLLANINDSEAHARELAQILRNRNALLNVIPYNAVEGLPYRTPSSAAIKRFREILQSYGINVKFRQRKGDKINAACGQLRRITQTTDVVSISEN